MEGWYVLKTKPNYEFIVREQLVERDIKCYLPLWQPVDKVNIDKKLRPYFPCYMFCCVDWQATSLSSLNYLPGVSYVITCDDKPIQVDPSVINGIQTQVCRLENSVRDRAGNLLRQGDRVKITSGVLDGYEAIFDTRLSSGDRVRLLINFLQTRTPLTIERNLIQKQ